MRSTARPEDALRLFGELPEPWWIAGGWAIDLWLGDQGRPHEDLDIAILRRDQRVFRRALRGWDLRVATAPGELRSLAPDDEVVPPLHVIWCRPTGADAWAFELLLNDAEGGEWLFRRDHAVRSPVVGLGGRTASGIPFLHPEFVLLYKAKQVRARDQDDLRRALPRLGPERRRWLSRAIARVHPGHGWLDELAG
jgi:hypothetical protein